MDQRLAFWITRPFRGKAVHGQRHYLYDHRDVQHGQLHERPTIHDRPGRPRGDGQVDGVQAAADGVLPELHCELDD